MNSIHDMGGMHGHGPIVRDESEAVFHEAWERSVFATMMLAPGYGLWNADESRYGMERMPPGEYLETPYYVHWLHSIELMLLEKGIITVEELTARIQALSAEEAD